MSDSPVTLITITRADGTTAVMEGEEAERLVAYAGNGFRRAMWPDCGSEWIGWSWREVPAPPEVGDRVRKAQGASPTPLSAVLDPFEAEIAAGEESARARYAGGQHVGSSHGDYFGHCPPSTRQRLRWWLRELREAAGVAAQADYVMAAARGSEAQGAAGAADDPDLAKLLAYRDDLEPARAALKDGGR